MTEATSRPAAVRHRATAARLGILLLLGGAAAGCSQLGYVPVAEVEKARAEALAEAQAKAAGKPQQQAAPAVAAAPAAASAPPPVLPFDEALSAAANKLLGSAALDGVAREADGRHSLIIDPLVDGVTGVQSYASRSMEAWITDLTARDYPQYDVKPFGPATVAEKPLVLVGTLTPVNAERKTVGKREAFRICLVLADLASGKTVSKGVAFAKMDGVDNRPTSYYADSPTWVPDPAVRGYIETCQGTKPGDDIEPAYLDGVLTASLISEAISKYDAGRFLESLDLYKNARASASGNQLRVLNGLYLTNWKLGRREEAAKAFGAVVDNGLETQRLAIKFLFRTGSTAFYPDPEITAPYGIWIEQVAQQVVRRNTCLEISGHTSPSGSAALNERLSLLRAEVIKDRLVDVDAALSNKLITNGVGSRETIVGSGADDLTDALDRRVEFTPFAC